MAASDSAVSISKVPFVFGACRARALPGPVLVRLLGDLDQTPAAAKGLLHRLVTYSLLDLTRHGRVGVYRLSGRLREGFESLRDADAPTTWDGRFHVLVHQIPESRRAERETFVHAALRFGYRQLRPGVLVGLTDASAGLGELLTQAGVVPGWLEVDAPAAADIVDRAWDLPALAQRYAEAIAAAQRPTLDHQGAEAFRVLFDASTPGYLMLAEEGQLPRWALPPDWPAPRLTAALGELDATLGPAAAAHADAVMSESRYAQLVERDEGITPR